MKDNKLIAEFMGWDIKNPTTIPTNLHLSNLELDNGEVMEFKYHTSWDWLIPVVARVKEIIDDEQLEQDISQAILENNKEQTNQLIVDFIKSN